jgi:hypothetical protein
MDLALGVTMPTVLAILALLPLLRGGFIFYGDEMWPFYAGPSDALRFISSYFYSWYGGPNTTEAFFFGALMGLLLLLGGEFANHALTFILAWLPGPIAYFSILATLRLFYTRDDLLPKLSALVGSMFYLVNWQNPGLITPMYTWSLSYSVMPALIYLAVAALKKRSLTLSVAFGAVASLGDAVPTWIPFMALFLLLLFIFHVIYGEGGPPTARLRSALALLSVMIASAVAFSSYVIVPSAYGFLNHLGGVYTAYASTNWGFVKFQSFYKLIDVLMYGQPKFYYFGLNPRNWGVLSPFIVGAAVASLLFINRVRRVGGSGLSAFLFSIVSSLLVAMFLEKGSNPPFGELYRVLIMIPTPGIVGMIREPTFWGQLVSVLLAFSISLTAMVGIHALHERRVSGFILVALVSLALAAGTFSAGVNLGYYTYQRFAPMSPPSYYSAATKFVDGVIASKGGYVMAVPDGGGYVWKLNGTLPLTSFEQDWFKDYSPAAGYLTGYVGNPQIHDFGKILALGGVRFFVLDGSGYFNGENATYLLPWLNSQEDMKLVWHEGFLYVYENEEPLPSVSAGLPSYGSPLPLASSISSSAGFEPLSTVYANSSGLAALVKELGLISPVKSISLNSVGPTGYQLIVPEGMSALVVYSSAPSYYTYSPSTASVVNVTKTPGGYNYTVQYSLPGYDVANGFRGDFWAGFGPLVEVYPYGQNPEWGPGIAPLNRVYEDLDVRQVLKNATSGYLYFSLPSFNQSVSVYIAFHGCCFAPISPLFYLNSLVKGVATVEPLQAQSRVPAPYQLLGPGNYTLQPFLVSSGWPSLVNGTFAMNETYYVPTMVTVGRLNVQGLTELVGESNIVAGVLYSSGGTKWNSLPQGEQLEFPANYTIRFDTPIPGNYTVSLSIVGVAILNGTTYSQGNYSFNARLPSNFTLHISSSNGGYFLLEAELVRIHTNASVTDFIQLSPVEYKGMYSSNTSSLVSFDQPFSSGWELSFDGKTYKPVEVAGGAMTGFLLPPGNGEFTIYYSAQPYFDLGYALTAISWALFALYFIRQYFRKYKAS